MKASIRCGHCPQLSLECERTTEYLGTIYKPSPSIANENGARWLSDSVVYEANMTQEAVGWRIRTRERGRATTPRIGDERF